jgi:hypothetical protein
MNPFQAKKGYWLTGMVVALIGVAAVRLIAPGLSGTTGKAITLAGGIFSMAGIAVIALGVKRRAEAEQGAAESQACAPPRR